MVASGTCFLMILLSLMFYTVLSQINGASSTPRKHTFYIVLVDPHSKPYPFPSHKNWYSSLISISSAPIHVYNHLFHGFSARLTLDNAKYVENSGGVLGVFQDSVLQLHTTRSPSFLGLHHLESLLVNSSSSDVVIGLIDTGIWPESESFSDEGFGDIPSRWKGECEEGNGFNSSNCNKKLVGARFFLGGYEGSFGGSGEYRSPRDSDGHGTHVASIAAGAPVPESWFFGFAGGVARGMAPGARISIYKVCWASGCLMSDVVAGFDKAVSDGVNIISYSLGLSELPFYLDLLAISAFRAVERGVLVVASAGNDGPLTGSITNAPPWILTVGAGTLDRKFPARIHLGNGEILSGESVTLSTRSILGRHPLQLYLLRNVTSSSFEFSRKRRQDFIGKIVFCMVGKHVPRLSLGMFLKKAGALAMLISHGEIDPEGLISEPHEIPTITVSVKEAQMAADYILADENPVAAIFSGGTVSKHARPAPTVASFSSRGPNSMVPAILKPDIIGPGVNILAAWTGAVGPSGSASDDRRSRFNILSGTSMACPHVAGVGALIKSVHPNWGPSEIKSALMTTATIQQSYHDDSSTHFSPILDESTNNAATPFAIGAGHIYPKRAIDSHLVFDTIHQDYIHFFCKLNYTKKQIEIITGKPINILCSNLGGPHDLNYPAILVEEEVARRGVALVRRLKKVSEGAQEYKSKVVGPRGYYRINVKPKKLKFLRIGERLRFTVYLEGQSRNRRDLWVGAIIWKERLKKHTVRCPIVIYPTNA